MFMYMSTHDAQDVLQFNRQVADILRPLSPTLLHLAQDNTAAALRRLYTFRGHEWMDWALAQTTKEQWFQSRGLTGFDGWVQFFEAWLSIAEQSYHDWPYGKMKIRNPHDDWTTAYSYILTLLEI